MGEQERLLTIFLRLQSGERLTKSELAEEYSVSEKTIQRDFSLLNAYLSSQNYVSGELMYDHKTYERYFKRKSQFNKKEILVISKILLENRAFNKEENNSLIEGLLALLSKSDQKEIENIIASEKLNYAPLYNKQPKIDKIWDFSEFIRKEQMVSFDYISPYREGVKIHIVLPVSLYYDDRYFYLKGYDMAEENYLDFRLDRVIKYEVSKNLKPYIPYRNKFRDGDIRNYKVDAFNGEKISLRIYYTSDPTIILDKFPNSKIVKQCDRGVEILIETQNTLGLKRYIISQLDGLKVLSPQSFVDDIKIILTKMQKNY